MMMQNDVKQVLRCLSSFLNGVMPLEGAYFGEKAASHQGMFWWRSRYLPKLDEAADTIERQDAEIAALQARVAELGGDLAKARNPQWFYAEGSEDHCLSDPSDAIDFYDLAVGKHVVPVGCARPLPDIRCAVHVRTKEEREASEHHEPFVFTEHASEDEARAAISKEPTP